MAVSSQSFANNSTSLLQAQERGLHRGRVTSPLRPSQLATAYLVGGLVRGFGAAMFVALLAAPAVGLHGSLPYEMIYVKFGFRRKENDVRH